MQINYAYIWQFAYDFYLYVRENIVHLSVDTYDQRKPEYLSRLLVRFALNPGEHYISYLFPLNIANSIQWNKCYGYTIKNESSNVSAGPSWPFSYGMVVVLTTTHQWVYITIKVVSSNPAHGEVYSIQHYVIKLLSVTCSRLMIFSPPPPGKTVRWGPTYTTTHRKNNVIKMVDKIKTIFIVLALPINSVFKHWLQNNILKNVSLTQKVIGNF